MTTITVYLGEPAEPHFVEGAVVTVGQDPTATVGDQAMRVDKVSEDRHTIVLSTIEPE